MHCSVFYDNPGKMIYLNTLWLFMVHCIVQCSIHLLVPVRVQVISYSTALFFPKSRLRCQICVKCVWATQIERVKYKICRHVKFFYKLKGSRLRAGQRG